MFKKPGGNVTIDHVKFGSRFGYGSLLDPRDNLIMLFRSYTSSL